MIRQPLERMTANFLRGDGLGSDSLIDLRPVSIDAAWIEPTARAHDALADPVQAPLVVLPAHGVTQTLAARILGAAMNQASVNLHHDNADGMSAAFTPWHLPDMPAGGSGSTASASPSQASAIAFEAGVDVTGKVVATSYWTWDSDTPATYATESNAHKWGSATGHTAGGTVDYYFDPASSWSTTEKAVFTACLTLWSDVANIHFALTANAGAADITFHRGNNGQAVTPGAWSGSGSAGTEGGSTLWTMTSATVSIDTSVPGFGPIDGLFSSIGGYVWETILHEEGHAIGLGHSGPYNGNVDPSTQQFSAYDSRLWTIMSYIDPDDASAKYFSQYPVAGTDWGTSDDGYGNVPTTMMPDDILAVQSLYGASASAAYSGGQTFGFNCNIADVTKEFYDFTVNTNPVVTLWDRGTGNTLDLSGFSTASRINLNPGTFSNCDGHVNNIAIAYSTAIDGAVGGAGNDTFIANADADHLVGGGGNDFFNLGATFTAADSIDGGTGGNTLSLNGDYTGVVTFTDTTMVNIQKIILGAGHNYDLATADANVAAGAVLTVDAHTLAAANSLTFDGSKETNGKFTITGGAGADIITGGFSNDRITGGLGADQLRGGPSHDTFIYTQVADSTSTTHDLIFDFRATQDKFDLWFTPSGVSATIASGTLNGGAQFNANLATAVSSLTAHHAVLFTPNAGTLSGHVILVVDVNGTAGYQAGADLVIDLEHATDMASFGAANFI